MPLLRGCCSLDLKVGTKIIGIVFLILNLFGFVTALVCLLSVLILQDVILNQLVPLLKEGLQGHYFNGTEVNHENIDAHTDNVMNIIEKNMDIITIVILVVACQQLLDIICSSLVIHAIRKSRRGFLMPWIVSHVLYFVVEIGLVVIMLVATVYLPTFVHVLLPAAALSLLWIALHIYLVLVVISQFQALGMIRMHDEMCLK